MDELAVEVQVVSRNAVNRVVLFRFAARSRSDGAPALGLIDQALELADERLHIALRYDDAICAIAQYAGVDARDFNHHGRQASRHRLEQYVRKAFPMRRGDKDVGGLEELVHVGYIA